MTTPLPRVLVVDDERFFRESIRDALAVLPIRCEMAETGEEALKLAESAAVEAVVLDVRLPGQSGIDVLRTLREQRPSLHVIVLSAHTDQDLVLEALRLGATDYLAKPIHEEELRLAVSRALDGTRRSVRWESLCARLAMLCDDARALDAGAGDTPPEERTAALAPRIVESAAELLLARRASLLVADADGLRVAAITGSDLEARDLPPAPAAESVGGLALGAPGVLRIEDVDRDARCAGRPRRGRYATPTALLAPVDVDGAPWGVLCVADPRTARSFGVEDEALLGLLAAHLGALLSGVPPAAEVGHESPPSAVDDAAAASDPEESRRVELVRAVCEAMTHEVEPLPLLRAALRPIAEALDAVASIHLLDGRSGALVLEAQWERGVRADRERLPRDRGLTGLVVQTGRLVATLRPQQDGRFDPEVDTAADGVVGPLLALPLCVRGKVLGVARVLASPEAGISADAGEALAPALSARTGELLAPALSAAIRNVLLYRSLLESIDDVARARRDAGGHRAG